ncbi:MAG: carbon monoxide dehydrogenase subunit G [Pseudomonadales bacterium]
MEQTGEYRIRAVREVVWKALNDAEILGRCIPGCESLVAVEENRFVAAVTSKIGPVKARFQGEITLSELDPPQSYTLTGRGQGGAAGFARGEARVQLDDEGDETLLKYELAASVGGKLAQVGSRLVDGVVRKLADDFFTSFKEVIEGEVPGGVESRASEAESGRAIKRWMWVVIVLATAALLLL